MIKIKAAIAGILALFAVASATAQQFPTVPDRTVIGRIGVGGQSGPSQAIPFAALQTQISAGAIYVTTSLQTAYNLCPSTGGIVYVPANYTETLAADLSLDRSYCGFVFLGPATITTGTHRINIGATANGVFLRGSGAYQSSISGVAPVGINIVSAVTAGAAVNVGSSGVRTNYHTLANLVVDMRAASAGTVGIQLTRTIFWTLDHVSAAGGNGNNTGISIDGTAADFGGFGEIINPQVRNFQKGVVTTGAANAIRMTGGLVDCNSIGSSVALTRDGTLTTTGGFIVEGTELSTCTTGASLIGIVTGDSYLLYHENNTTDVSFGASTLRNEVRFFLSPFTKSDSGTNNLAMSLGLPVLGVATGSSIALNGCTIGTGVLCAGGTVAFASANISAFTVGSASNNVFQVDTSAGTANTGVKITSAAAGAGSFLAAISSGTNEALRIDGKGSGGIILGGISTGAITLTRATTLSAALTYGGVTLNNAVTGTGDMVLRTSPALSSPVLTTPALGVATGTSLALGGCTIGANALCTTGAALLDSGTSITKNQNATTDFSVLNTDTTNSTSRAQFSFQAGGVTGRLLAIHGDAFYLGSLSASAFNLQYNGTNQVVINGTTVAAQVPLVTSGATATPAGGSTAARMLFGTTAGFGIYYGSGAPTVSAAQGSIYLRSDGSSGTTRMYINTNGSTTWINVTTPS